VAVEMTGRISQSQKFKVHPQDRSLLSTSFVIFQRIATVLAVDADRVVKYCNLPIQAEPKVQTGIAAEVIGIGKRLLFERSRPMKQEAA
jgi:hypothetical protein